MPPLPIATVGAVRTSIGFSRPNNAQPAAASASSTAITPSVIHRPRRDVGSGGGALRSMRSSFSRSADVFMRIQTVNAGKCDQQG